MESLQIREVTTSDIPSLIGLISQEDMSPDNELNYADVEKILSTIKNTNNHELFVAVLDNNIVGTFALFIIQHLSHSGAKSMIIEDVVVKSNLQGQGIGKVMMNFAIKRGVELGCYKIALSSGKRRTDAHAFYEKLGFEKHGYTFYLNLN